MEDGVSSGQSEAVDGRGVLYRWETDKLWRLVSVARVSFWGA